MTWWTQVQNVMQRSRDVVISSGYDETEKRSQKATITDPSWCTSPIHGSPRNINYSELLNYEKDITVSAARNFIIDSIATTEWHIIPDDELDGDEDINKDNIINFFKSDTWHDSFESVLRSLCADILHYDSGVLVKVFPEIAYDENKNLTNEKLPPLELRARDGRSFLARVNAYGDILSWWQYSFLNFGAAPMEFNPIEIIYMQEAPSSRSPYSQTCKLEIVKNAADLMMSLQEMHRAEQENNFNVGGIAVFPNTKDSEMIRLAGEKFNATLRGPENAGRWLVTGSEIDLTPFTNSTMDDSWISGAEFYQQAILSIYKVPKTVLGMVSANTNRATSISQATTFKRMGVSTLLTLIENYLTREVVKMHFDDRLLFRFVREQDLTDEAIRAEIDQKNVMTGIRTVNEIRERDGLEELEENEIKSEPESLEESPEIPENPKEEFTAEEITEKSIKMEPDKKFENRTVKDIAGLTDEIADEVLSQLGNIYNES